MSPEQVITVAEQASKQSDRTLFIAMLIIVVGGGAWIIKWLISYIKDKDNDQRTVIREAISIMDKVNGSHEQTVKAVTELTKAVAEIRADLRDHPSQVPQHQLG